MKFTITREQLQEGLGAVAAAIPAKTTLPVLANVLVEATKQGGGLRLSGTDLDIAVSTTAPADVDADGAVTLPAKKLVDIARELPSGPVRLDRKSTRLNSSHSQISYAVFCLKKKKKIESGYRTP